MLHDRFSIDELTTFETLYTLSMGKAVEDIDGGFYDLDGKIPCQSHGGLKCFGHLIGAFGS